MDDSFDLRSLVDEFRSEAREQLNELDLALLRIEDGGTLNDEQRRSLLRALHTLKGNSAMLGLRPIAEQVHALENIVKVEGEGGGIPSLDPVFELSAALRSALARLGGHDQDAALARVAAVDLRARAPDPGHPRSGPITPPAPPTGDLTASPVPRTGDESSPGSGEILRVQFGKLDELLARVAEMTSVQSRLDALVRAHRSELTATGVHRELKERVNDLARIGANLQDATMNLRLVPLRTVLGRFPAVVRDLARTEGKRVRVVVEGDDIELDKSLVDALGEPLMHLIRNAVDHGIDTPSARERAGKDATGTIWINARREGDRIVLEIGDDGQGLDHAEILRRGAEAGLLSDGEQPSDEEIEELIFSSGFSTRTEATTISGRGVGLDIVRQSLVRLRGSLDVETSASGTLRRLPGIPAGDRMLPFLSRGLHDENRPDRRNAARSGLAVLAGPGSSTSGAALDCLADMLSSSPESDVRTLSDLLSERPHLFRGGESARRDRAILLPAQARGILFLGHAETLSRVPTRFVPIRQHCALFYWKPTA